MKILLFIGTLSSGGAERQLALLAKGLSARGHSITVVTLFPGGQIAADIRKLPEIELVSLCSRRGDNFFSRFFQILTAPFTLRALSAKADCLYSMLEVTNFIAWLASRGDRSSSLVWGIRSSSLAGHWKMELFDRLCAFFSPTVDLLITNSYSGADWLIDRGYRPKKYEVIPNGIDTERFRYNEAYRKKSRKELGLLPKHRGVGIVARLDPIKDYPSFLRAAALVSNEIENVRFLCVGHGTDYYASTLISLAIELGIDEKVVWLGDRSDLVALYSAMDILVSSSYSEGFSNVIGEAMSCELKCIVTDVGDSRRLVGDCAHVVEAGNSIMLAQSIADVLKAEIEPNRDARARIRIEEHFSADRLIDITEDALSRNHASN